MKRFFVVWLLLAHLASHGASSPDPAGHWEGKITLPATSLGIRVALERDPGSGGWMGSIDIPVQGLRGFKLGEIQVDGEKVSFVMPGIPGTPRFEGRLTGPGSMGGEFTQGVGRYPFAMERTERRDPLPGETPAKGVPGTGLAGFWQGSLKPTPVIELRLLMELTNRPTGGTGGVLMSVDQGNVSIPITALEETPDRVRIETASVGGEFVGKLNSDGSELGGEWSQRGRGFELVFKRLNGRPVLRRPQEPNDPLPYEEEEVTIENEQAGIRLAGTLTSPRSAGPHPAVMLITGSGAQDRDEAIMGHRPFLVLADHLTRKGIVVLRCDDRGVGKSTGSFAEATHEDFVTDVLAGVRFLAGHAKVATNRLGLIGHSEGGIVGPLAAVESSEIRYLVLLAGVGVPMEQLLLRQAEDIARVMGGDPVTLARNAEIQKQIFALLREEPDELEIERKVRALFEEQVKSLSPDELKALGLAEGAAEAQLKLLTSPWFRKLLTYDPRPTLRAVRCPVLALNGEKDLQVAAGENLSAIAAALKEGGNTRVEVVELPRLNHLFQTCETGAVAEYGTLEETMAPVALNKISDWILGLGDSP